MACAIKKTAVRGIMVLGLLGGMAVGGAGAQSIGPGASPSLEVVIIPDGGRLMLEADGPPLQAGTIHVVMTPTGIPGAASTTYQVPVQFDASGHWSASVDMTTFALAPEFEMLLTLEVTDPATQQPVTSIPWGLRMERRMLDAEFVRQVMMGMPLFAQWTAPIPGTTAPLYPISYGTALVTVRNSPVPQEVLLFLTGPHDYLLTVPGIEGIFPVN